MVGHSKQQLPLTTPLPSITSISSLLSNHSSWLRHRQSVCSSSSSGIGASNPRCVFAHLELDAPALPGSAVLIEHCRLHAREPRHLDQVQGRGRYLSEGSQGSLWCVAI